MIIPTRVGHVPIIADAHQRKIFFQQQILTHFYLNFTPKIIIVGKYLYVVNVYGSNIRIRILAYVRIIRMNCKFPHPHSHP